MFSKFLKFLKNLNVQHSNKNYNVHIKYGFSVGTIGIYRQRHINISISKHCLVQ